MSRQRIIPDQSWMSLINVRGGMISARPNALVRIVNVKNPVRKQDRDTMPIARLTNHLRTCVFIEVPSLSSCMRLLAGKVKEIANTADLSLGFLIRLAYVTIAIFPVWFAI